MTEAVLTVPSPCWQEGCPGWGDGTTPGRGGVS